MAAPSDLIRVLLGRELEGHVEPLAVLEAALSLEVDPLAFLIQRHGIDESVIYERAARFCGLAFAPLVPDELAVSEPPARHLEALALGRSMRAHLHAREIVFISPDFHQFLRLRDHVDRHPEVLRQVCVVPLRPLREAVARRHRDVLADNARQCLALRWPFASAHLELTLAYRVGFVVFGALVIAAALISPFWLEPLLVPPLAVFLLLPAWLRFLAMDRRSAIENEPRYPLLRDSDLPVYTVLLPLRDEAHMVRQLAAAMLALDYPAEKLDIKFVVEASSEATVSAVTAQLHHPQFELVVVPDGAPRTKPKALNYALPLVRGEHVVIYDAEDVPDADQLRRAASRFAAFPRIACLQAELAVENASENWLTSLFAAEYAALFGLMLPALASWGLPMPLGGTSNHLRMSALRQIGGWDAFNVTEDADMGVRLSRLRFASAALASRTLEEAPVTLEAWMRQRTRWMKGWMQTFLVHNRRPLRLLRETGWRNFLAFEIYVGGLIICPPLHTALLVALVLRLLFGQGFASPMDTPWVFASYVVLVIGYASAVALSIAGWMRLRLPKGLARQALLPVYWTLMGVAALRAARELIVRPYFWDKTRHGRSRLSRAIRLTAQSAPAAPRRSEDKWNA